MLIHLKKTLSKFHGKRQALGAFNTFNLEVSRAIIQASSLSHLPLIIQVTPKSLDYAGAEAISFLIKTFANNYYPKSLVSLHLDHGKDLKTIAKCIKLGFSSVHFDGSLLPFKQNIYLTKKIVQYAQKHQVLVQGEVGAILGKEGLIKLQTKENKNKFFTDPLKAREFVKKTQVNTLAVSVGSLHGLYKGKENLDFERIKTIKNLCPKTPLILHGASGISTKDLKKAVRSGITVFNLDTALRVSFTNTIKKSILKNHSLIDPRVYLNQATEGLTREIINYQKILASR